MHAHYFLLYRPFSASTALHLNQASLACFTASLVALQAVPYTHLKDHLHGASDVPLHAEAD